MTEEDRKAFTTAFVKLCACYDRTVDPTQCAAWFEYLEDLPLGAIEAAMRTAPRESGRFFPSVGQVGKLAIEQRGAGRGQQSSSVGRANCAWCEGTGWVPVLTEGRRMVSRADLREWERQRPLLGAPREDGQPHYRSKACHCKGSGAGQAGAA